MSVEAESVTFEQQAKAFMAEAQPLIDQLAPIVEARIKGMCECHLDAHIQGTFDLVCGMLAGAIASRSKSDPDFYARVSLLMALDRWEESLVAQRQAEARS